MRYEFDSGVVGKLTLSELMAEKAILEELYTRVRIESWKREEEMEERKDVTTEKRETTKAGNGWIDKRVGERRVRG